MYKTSEPNRDRWEEREVLVYDDLYEIDNNKWASVQQIIKVVRKIYQKRYIDKIPSIQVSYYISSKNLSASEYNLGIRNHWSIENSLHYVKDVTFKEDNSLIRTGNAPTNFSFIRNIALNVFRRNNYNNIAQAIRLIGGDIKKLSKLLE